MELNPKDYFSGQQLVLAEVIAKGDEQSVQKLVTHTDLNKPVNMK